MRTGKTFLLSAFLAVLAVSAAEAAPVSAEARVLRSRIRIGDELTLLVRVDHPRKFTVTPPSAGLNVAPFEIKRVDPEPLLKGQNRVQQTFRLTLTVFQTGDVQVPPVPVEYSDAEGRPGRVMTEPVPVKVASVGKKLTDKDDIRPIKGPASTGLLRFWTVLGFLAAGALAAALAVLLIVRVRRERASRESRKPPHERVKIELSRLKDKGFLEEKDYKSFYSGLSDILRVYLERQLKVEALEKTTSELCAELSLTGMDPAALEAVRAVLTESDLVKFAKVRPDHELAGRLEALLFDAVERTRPAEVKKK